MELRSYLWFGMYNYMGGEKALVKVEDRIATTFTFKWTLLEL